MLYVLFLLAFVAGPALYFWLLRHNRQVWPLALVAVLLAVMSFGVRHGTALPFGSDAARSGESVLLLWLAWVLVVVLVVQVLGRAFASPVARNRSRTLGAVGTTLPWFGFAAAQMMAD